MADWDEEADWLSGVLSPQSKAHVDADEEDFAAQQQEVRPIRFAGQP